jgi:histidinol-phosphate aminotransferase
MSAPATLTAFVDSVIRPEVRALSSYKVAKAEGMIKLDAMENPYPLPEPLRAAMGEELARVAVNRYPDGSGVAVKQALAKAMRIPDGAALLLGNGSDEIIQMLATAAARPGASLLAPAPSFVMYENYARLYGLRYVAVPLREDFSLDLAAMLAAIDRDRPALTFLAYPNNPTGNLFAGPDIEAIVRASPGLVVVDEAYYAFADASFLPRLGEFPNLLVMRTLSKLGLAGVRLGFAAAAPAWIAEVDKVRPPYNVNSLTQRLALSVLERLDLLQAQADIVSRERERVREALSALPGTRVFPSAANFVLVRFPDAAAAFESLCRANILVKSTHGWHPLLAQCLRITVGTPAENDALIANLTELLA